MDRRRIGRMGAWAGITGVISFNLLFAISLYLHPEWRFGADLMSELGTSGPDAWLFNSGVMIVGALGTPFALGLHQLLPCSGLGRASTALMGGGFACLFLLGAFPMDYGELHDDLAWGFFILSALALLVVFIPLHKAGRTARTVCYATSAVLLFSISCLLSIWLKIINNHMAEVLVVYAFGTWIVLTSAFMLRRSREDAPPITPGTDS